mmetsp:Transcript_85024/g.216602  ORF Transcript_85024/g.216602 Transcript_85024/m.216602 type:complete len:134 (+) Transcript_85024:73-474(+)
MAAMFTLASHRGVALSGGYSRGCEGNAAGAGTGGSAGAGAGVGGTFGRGFGGAGGGYALAGHEPDCLTCCGKEAVPPVMSFVGGGHGEFAQEMTYKFVGDGCGEYDVVAMRIPARTNTALAGIACVGVALLEY